MSEHPPLPRTRVLETEARLAALSHEQLVRELAFQIVWEAYADQIHEQKRAELDLAQMDRDVATRIADMFEAYGLTKASA